MLPEILVGLWVGWTGLATLIAGYYMWSQRNVVKYLKRQTEKYPLMSPENRIYSDMLNVIALDGKCEPRDDFGTEPLTS